MIVKNEERHIERALGWAKGYAFEQIVVDTGSTDRTVELAEKLGAKVFHFEWINDFSAAKNFAMDQARGDWIAILDADEYMPDKDVKELMSILERIQNDPLLSEKYDAITNSWVQLDDNDNVFAMLTNQRIFRNSPELRYVGKIHEAITLRRDHVNATNLRIMHTGYARTVFSEADKSARNLKLLRDEYNRDPEDPNILLYLADSVKSAGTRDSYEEAEQLYKKALASTRPVNVLIKQLGYDFLISLYVGDRSTEFDKSKKDELLKLCNDAIADLPNNIDYYFYRAVVNSESGNYAEAWEDFIICENALLTGGSLPSTRVLLPSPIPLFFHMKKTAQALGDEPGAVRNATILHTMLTDAKSLPEVIGAFIRRSLMFGFSEDETLNELAEIYDLENPKDLMFIARTSKDSGAISFARKIMEMVKEAISDG
jgi:glycosyltransferase involved in cell wall biosynthesis